MLRDGIKRVATLNASAARGFARRGHLQPRHAGSRPRRRRPDGQCAVGAAGTVMAPVTITLAPGHKGGAEGTRTPDPTLPGAWRHSRRSSAVRFRRSASRQAERWTSTTDAGTASRSGEDEYVLSADEKSQLQALHRRHPDLPPAPDTGAPAGVRVPPRRHPGLSGRLRRPRTRR